MEKYQALVLEDNVSAKDAVVQLLELEGFSVTAASNLAQAREALTIETIDCAVLDLDVPDGSGMELLEGLKKGRVEILILTGRGSIDTAVEAMRMGVTDFLTKPLDTAKFEKSLRDIRKTLDLRRTIAELRIGSPSKKNFAGMIGNSPAIRDVYRLIEKVAPSTSSVLITGETGTGKEVTATAIHRLSARSRKPLISVNCGAFQPSLIESELFGHEAGAFTGASKRKKGVFERAHGGTLFLDELFEMPLELQVNLLRVLETRTVTRVGGETTVPVDFRLIAATNKPVAEAKKSGAVREDLLYRLMVFPIELPPLRSRAEDIPLLAQHFLDLFIGIGGQHKIFKADALQELSSRKWPGNIRELRNMVERAYVLSDSAIDVDHLRESLVRSRTFSAKLAPRLPIKVGMSLARAESELILATMKAVDEDQHKAARMLEIEPERLAEQLKALDGSPVKH